jgi:hypothetical protein
MKLRMKPVSAGEHTGAPRGAARGGVVRLAAADPNERFQLASLIGNRALGRLLQAKLTVGSPGDKYEREADRVADQVMRMPARDEPVTGGTEAAAASRPGPVGAALGAGRPLAGSERAFFEPRFGTDFGGVRVHTGAHAGDLSRGLGARAFTVGRDVAFANGQYTPHGAAGRRLLAHELAHVVQQSRVPEPTRPHALAASLSKAPAHEVQRKLVATGDPAGFANLANSVIAVQFEVVVSAAGLVSLRRTNVQGPPTPAAAELVSVLRTVIGNSNTTTIEFIHGASSTRASDRRVMIGSFPQGKVDLDDIERFGFGVGQGITAGSALAHEIQEQFRKQVHSDAISPAHASGIAAEERAAGARRGAATQTLISATTREITIPYTYPDGRIVDVKFTVTNGNVTNVVRTTRRTP